MMIWWTFCEKKLSNLAFLNRKKNASMYIKTLEEFLLPFAEQKYYGTWKFQQDNASIHGANVIKKWL